MARPDPLRPQCRIERWTGPSTGRPIRTNTRGRPTRARRGWARRHRPTRAAVDDWDFLPVAPAPAYRPSRSTSAHQPGDKRPRLALEFGPRAQPTRVCPSAICTSGIICPQFGRMSAAEGSPAGDNHSHRSRAIVCLLPSRAGIAIREPSLHRPAPLLLQETSLATRRAFKWHPEPEDSRPLPQRARENRCRRRPSADAF